MSEATPVWVVLPAAGAGRRMRAAEPKQYLRLIDTKTVMQCTLERLLGLGLERLIVAVAPGDTRAASVLELLEPEQKERVEILATGGNERADTVLNTLQALDGRAADEDLVLVHDLARPCLCRSDLDAVVTTAVASRFGAILGIPVSDTLKRCVPLARRDTELPITETVPRALLWRAMTPQVIRYAALRESLEQAERKWITDEASALEQSGKEVLMVAGRSDNIKITQPEDLALAAFLYRQQLENGLAFASEQRSS
ncbi:2-C-methyl-D-erythritol 4-phosphate cytidylyltransferase [Allohahella sp. A8]|uniref:2-C-methyl-D-erythritol 4-phosphate cytidylyltransferase n=1 Tax=Allohahella sp. A8 TaxID=3141461 RepID=UPI000C0B92B3|nr:2-C-methyl-D-erythritol 4-phosphate cytidylyltransferase [Hahellaceae bacterium]|tara:strand:- start:20146 stop:20913 length:768 start_codon:yes stop_codon:yes gene_type:complete